MSRASVLAVIVAFAGGGLAVPLLRHLVGGSDPGEIAAIRTAVLAAAALLLAAAPPAPGPTAAPG